jgi:hypothetical protein
MMFNFNQSKKFLAIVGCALVGFLFAGSANAANPEPVTAEVEFVAPVTITETNALQYGLLDVNLANLETVVIAPNGSVTDASLRVLSGPTTLAAAALTVGAEAGRAIDILIDVISGNTGYSLGSFMCNYNGAAGDSACSGASYMETSVLSATLLVGATLTGDGAAVAGVANGNFNVTVTYQ